MTHTIEHIGYALVRNPQGKPKFDSINNIHEGYWQMLSPQEKLDIVADRKLGVTKWL